MTNSSRQADPATLGPTALTSSTAAVHEPLRSQPGSGMWAVAWRQHRVQVAVLVGIMAASIGAMVAFRQLAIARLAFYGCTPDTVGCMVASGGGQLDVWSYDLQSAWYAPEQWWALMHIAMIGAPIVLAAFAGSVIFPREFARGTQVFALTQGVSRRQWWAAKIAVLGPPVIVGLLAMGYVAQWVDNTFAATRSGALREQYFLVQGPIPAAIGLASFALAVTIGIYIRNLMGALVTALVAALALTIGAMLAYPYLITPIRETTPIAEAYGSGGSAYQSDDADRLWLGSSYLDVQGNTVKPSAALQSCGAASWAASQQAAAAIGIDLENFQGEVPQSVWAAGDRATVECLTSNGVTEQYVDYQPGSRLWPLRLWLIAYCVILGAAVLAAGAWRLPRAVAKR